jgi:hypothetical protein
MTILNFRLPVLAVFPLLLGVEWATSAVSGCFAGGEWLVS